MPRIHIVTDTGELVDTLDINTLDFDIDSPIHMTSIKEWVDEALHRAYTIQEKERSSRDK